MKRTAELMALMVLGGGVSYGALTAFDALLRWLGVI